MLCPALTSLQPIERGTLVSPCIEWIVRGGRRNDWRGDVLVQPADSVLFVGESTGAPATTPPAATR